ncbi:hypothetical protein MKS88_004040 [Plasmodium brasilianum]|uniref:Uncharacterized protein n=1 Tax=Plasmodium brasilianum TaxID=5824 RepID=A0ACB9Y493_PLABR|nr:hypothetical protein MKS88_004040 [Plasmodium brasilianum]
MLINGYKDDKTIHITGKRDFKTRSLRILNMPCKIIKNIKINENYIIKDLNSNEEGEINKDDFLSVCLKEFIKEELYLKPKNSIKLAGIKAEIFLRNLKKYSGKYKKESVILGYFHKNNKKHNVEGTVSVYRENIDHIGEENFRKEINDWISE